MKVRVFVASPGDVTGERDQLKKVVEELNGSVGEDRGFTIDLVRWETHCHPAAGPTQPAITEQVGPYDIFVGIMWKRFGTPTAEAGSGTEEEFNLAYNSWEKYGKPEILFYFCEAPLYSKTKEEAEQHYKIVEFRERLKDKVFTWSYQSHDEFADIVRRHLDRTLRKMFPLQAAPSQPTPAAKAHVASTALATRRPASLSPPPRWWAAVVGWLDYLWAKALRENIFKDYRKEGLARPLVRDFKTPFDELGRGGGRLPPAKRITLINGPAGVGKTTYLDQLFRRLIGNGEGAPPVDLFIKLSTRDVEEAVRREGHSRLWQSIYAFFTARAAATAERPLTPAAVAYALSKKRILLIIEDLHLAVSSMAVLEFLESYFSKYHRWGNHISFLGTTRESPEKLPDELYRSAQVETLRPIGQEEAQNYFYKLCLLNGLPQERLTEHGDALRHAFATESLRVPLFVVISASLAAHPFSTRLDVGRVLRMNTPELFDAFINQLYGRSALPADRYEDFRDAYERLALALWPVRENFDAREAAKLLKEVAPPDSPFGVEFLEGNGFLHLDLVQGQLSFPHQAMADYLAAAAMVRHRQFGKLRESPQDTLAEGLIPFLAALIKPSEAPCALALMAQADPSVFVGVVSLHQAALARREAVVPWVIPSVVIARAVAEWATARAPRRQPPETWERLRDILDSTKATGWAEEFCLVAGEDAEGTSAGVEALAIVGCEAGRDILLRWLDGEQGVAAFRDVIETPQVQEFLLKLVKSAGLGTGLGRRAFGILASCQGGTVRNQLVRLAEENFDRLTEEGFKFLIKLGKEALSVLGYACEEQPEHLKRRLSSHCAEHLKKALVPPGIYTVEDADSRKIRVTVKKPILVPCMYERAGKHTSHQVQAHIGRKAGIKRLMSKELALVVHQHFSHGLQGSSKYGVLFPRASDGIYEAFRDGQKVGLFFFYPDTSGKMRLGSTGEHSSGGVQRGRDVVYRAVEEL